MKSSKTMISFFIRITADFYNSGNGYWEPIIEPFGIDTDLIYGEKLYLAIQNSKFYDSLNVNLSQEFVFL